jgi:hypothetical protein
MYWIVIGRKQRRIGRIQGSIFTKLLNLLFVPFIFDSHHLRVHLNLYEIKIRELSPFIYEENSIRKTGLIHTWTESRWAGGIANSLRASDRNIACSRDGSQLMGFTDTYLRYDIIKSYTLVNFLQNFKTWRTWSWRPKTRSSHPAICLPPWLLQSQTQRNVAVLLISWLAVKSEPGKFCQSFVNIS